MSRSLLMISSLEKEKQINTANEEKKSRMLLELSHDIRTPVATINNCAAALEEGLVADEKRREYYHIIRTKANRVAALSDSMFTLLKMENSKYQLTKTAADICEFVRQQCAEYYEAVENAGLELLVDIPDEPIIVNADYTSLARAIGNVMENAVQYNQTGSRIYVSVTKTSQSVIIKIADDGAPIAVALRSTLFEAFTRGDLARASEGGIGIGLSIAKAIITKHGGHIAYANVAGKNEFTITLMDQ